jgi:F1F0 ATPase subunit 2
MTEIIYLIFAFIAGTILGTIFFGGLWITVKKGISTKMPALLFAVSFALRTLITLGGFYYVSAGNFTKLVVCLMGFTVARFVIKQLTKTQVEKIQIGGKNT